MPSIKRTHANALKAVLPVAAIIVLSACTQHPQVGGMVRPATVIKTSKTLTVIEKITELCDRFGYQIERTDASSVTCSQMSSMMAQIFLGTRNGTQVRTKTQYSVFLIEKGKVRVSPRSWAENQTAFGQIRTQEMNTKDVNMSTQHILNIAKAELERK